jgi:carboxymethylenebutenolidase
MMYPNRRSMYVRWRVPVGEFVQIGPNEQGAYLALPPSGSGPGVLVLHAWWGLTPVFTTLCDRLAAEGFVALAPSLYSDGATATTIDDAQRLVDALDATRAEQVALAALDWLRAQPAVGGTTVGTVGFSMGAWWATVLARQQPDDVAAVVLYYGIGSGDFSKARAAFQGHFAEVDEWEPTEGVRAFEHDLRAAGREVEFHNYPDTSHWFFEPNRPEYVASAAEIAWDRTVGFLKAHFNTRAPGVAMDARRDPSGQIASARASQRAVGPRPL